MENPLQVAHSGARKRRRRRRVSALFVFALTAIGLIGSLFLVWSTIASERVEREQANRTNQIMMALRDIDRAAINAETGQRGYFITLDRRYLANYEFGRTLYPRALERLKRKTREGDILARQEQLLADIEQRADDKFAELAASVELIEQGEIREAQQRILSNEGRMAMERLRESLSEMEALEQGILAEASADAAKSEDRVLPLLAVTMLLTLGSLALGLSQTVRATHAEAQAAQAAELAEARDRADLLAHELNHRVKNLFAVILAIVRMSARDLPDARPVTEGIAARIHALLDAHEATQGKDADGNASMRRLVDKVLAPYLTEDNPVEVSGPEVTLNAREATPLGLVLHELATNAVKYGAWSENGGRIVIRWDYHGDGEDRELAIEWREFSDNPNPPTGREGFGSMLMQSSARQLGGKIERAFASDGMIVAIRIPHAV
ncbi:sensor histidine kinase [Croceicoccus bisphenolivorans]|uniref:sensor histidine kinase n=1 Tax=Croceicoccus bisphenolivorans TaxID=1783232 RepID=UPI0009ED7A46|nr:CHASE3 domain-containing protein [Croceicoccus bisphenolivorans]